MTSKMKYDVVIVGCGLAGSTLARRMAEERGKKVLIIEKRDHVGGNCYDFYCKEGIIVQRYGPHIFRTNSSQVWKFISRFTEWFDYQHKVLTCVGGNFLPIPINLDTVNMFLGTHYTSENILTYFEKNRTCPENVDNVKDSVESQIGTVFYDAFFKNYTEKQWGYACDELPAKVIARIPIRQNRDDRYFTHKYQGIPQEGYTNMIKKMLAHPNIHVLLNANFNDFKDALKNIQIYYSGSIDEYFDYCYGRLPYRCVEFEFEIINKEWFQKAGVVNYPNNYDYTRITEFKYFGDYKSEKTIIAKEYPSWNGDPSYPVPFPQNEELYDKYYQMKPDNLDFIGRLGKYRYYSMDQIIEDILEMRI